MRINVRTDIRQAAAFYTNLRERAIHMAASRAINDALITVRAEGARAIKREHPALKIGDIKNNMSIERAHRYRLRGEVRTRGRALSATLFALRGGHGKRGVRPLTAMFGKSREIVQWKGRGAFQVVRYGGEVFVRRYPKGRRIRRFRGPSLPGVFRARSEEFKVIAARRWAVTFPSRLRFEIERAKR